jgi:hypothetical protein
VSEKPKRRWYQFSLRGLMCLMLVIGTALGWWNYRRNEEIRRQARIERAVRLIGECPGPLGYTFNPVPLIRAVNELHSMGKEDAIKALRRVGAQRSTWGAHQSLRLVIPLLFGRIEPEDKLPEVWGRDGKYELELDEWDNWIDVEGDVPFHTKLIGASSGPGWNNRYLVEWAERDGRIRTSPLRPTDDPIGAADKVLQRLQRDTKDPEAKKWIAHHIRKQVYTALGDVVLHEQNQPSPWHPGGDEAWEAFKKQCHAQNLRWSEEQQNYVATIAKTGATP